MGELSQRINAFERKDMFEKKLLFGGLKTSNQQVMPIVSSRLKVSNVLRTRFQERKAN
jgi:hypothetical protein